MAAQALPDVPELDEIPEITPVRWITNFCRFKKNKIWVWTVANHWRPGIIAWTLGDRSAETFSALVKIIREREKFLVRYRWLYCLSHVYWWRVPHYL
jgi:hypothetical protein